MLKDLQLNLQFKYLRRKCHKDKTVKYSSYKNPNLTKLLACYKLLKISELTKVDGQSTYKWSNYLMCSEICL